MPSPFAAVLLIVALALIVSALYVADVPPSSRFARYGHPYVMGPVLGFGMVLFLAGVRVY